MHACVVIFADGIGLTDFTLMTCFNATYGVRGVDNAEHRTYIHRVRPMVSVVDTSRPPGNHPVRGVEGEAEELLSIITKGSNTQVDIAREE
jgi:hypothetical protein